MGVGHLAQPAGPGGTQQHITEQAAHTENKHHQSKQPASKGGARRSGLYSMHVQLLQRDSWTHRAKQATRMTWPQKQPPDDADSAPGHVQWPPGMSLVKTLRPMTPSVALPAALSSSHPPVVSSASPHPPPP